MRMKSVEARQERARGRTIPTNVSLDSALVAEARELGVNISRASALGLENAVAEARARRWLHENASALDSSNAFVESHGLPLQSLRQF
jgi:antitoxin CcdA